MKQFKMKTIMALLSVLLLLPSVAFADSSQPAPLPGAGDWDTILDSWYTVPAYGEERTPIVYSGGGDIRICVQGINGNNSVRFEIWSDDGAGDSVDDFLLPPATVNNNQDYASDLFCFPKQDARPHVDGSNGVAEFYVKMTSDVENDSVRVILQD